MSLSERAVRYFAVQHLPLLRLRSKLMRLLKVFFPNNKCLFEMRRQLIQPF